MTNDNPDRPNDNPDTITFSTSAHGNDRLELEADAVRQAREFFGADAQLSVKAGYTAFPRNDYPESTDPKGKFSAAVKVQYTPSIGGLSSEAGKTGNTLPNEKRPVWTDPSPEYLTDSDPSSVDFTVPAPNLPALADLYLTARLLGATRVQRVPCCVRNFYCLPD